MAHGVTDYVSENINDSVSSGRDGGVGAHVSGGFDNGWMDTIGLIPVMF